MALNATLGASDANSYVTLAEAETYFVDRMHVSAWGALTDEVKSNLLVSSSQMLDWYVKWKGTKTDPAQSMGWPRSAITPQYSYPYYYTNYSTTSGVLRPDGTEIGTDELPMEVPIAVFEQAFSNIPSDRTEDDPLAGIGKLSAGSLLIQAGPEKPNQTNAKPVPTHVFNILKDLYKSGGTVWLRRA